MKNYISTASVFCLSVASAIAAPAKKAAPKAAPATVEKIAEKSDATATDLSLDQYLAMVVKTNGLYQSADLAKDAALDRKDAGDIVLAPFLSASVGYLDDRKQTQIPIFEGNRTKAFTYDLGVSKRFSTGTTATVDFGSQAANIYGTQPVIPTQNIETLTFSLSQSLWKDFFGQATRLRHAREEKTYQLENKSQVLQARKVLVDAETAYWNYLYKVAEVQSRGEALNRAKTIQEWNARRESNGLSNESDVLQSDALLTQRQIQVDQSLDDLKATAATLRVAAHLDTSAPIDINIQDLAKERDLLEMIGAKTGDRVVRLDSELTGLDASLRAAIAQETADALKPDLNFDLKLASNGLDQSQASAWKNVGEVSNPTTYAGLRFSLNLDQGIVTKSRNAAAKDAQAAHLKSMQSALDSDTSWKELMRRYDELNRRIDVANKLSKIQRRKSESERSRLRNGRATTFQVVQFEQDLADSELLVLQLEGEARKLEAQAKMFKKVSESSETPASSQKDKG